MIAGHGQLASEVPSGDGGSVMALSASKEVAEEARAMLLHAEDLFRLDVCPRGDTLRTVARNLSPGDLRFIERGARGPVIIQARTSREIAALSPSRFDIEFVVGAPPRAVHVTVTLASLHHGDRGVTRITAQALLRKITEREYQSLG